MASNSFGELFCITTFGESHGPALGVVIDGCPAGLALEEADFLPELARRRPGQSAVTSSRKESDAPQILSGVFEGQTTGMPVAVVVPNQDMRSRDYEPLRHVFRAGHADETYAGKYGHRDHRGGGRSSGRETVSRVLAGVVARKLLPASTRIVAHAKQVGPHAGRRFVEDSIESNSMRCADPDVAPLMERYVMELADEHDSTGGLVEILVRSPPAHLGEPVFDKLKSRLASALMSVGAVTGWSYGAGFKSARMRGRDYVNERACFGGMLGGISTGEDLVLRVSVKPTTSLGEVARQGRHDPCIVPRVIPVLEAMVAIVLADMSLLARSRGTA